MSILYRGPSIDASYQISVHLGKRCQRRRFFRNQPIKNKNGLWRPCLLRIWTKWAIFIENLPKMLPTKFWFIWPGGFRGEDFFRNQPIRNKNDLWRSCLLTDRDEMSNLYRGHSIDAISDAVSEEKIKKINHSETRNAYGAHVCLRIGMKWAIFIEDVPRMLPTKFQFIWESGYRGEYIF